MNRIYQLVGKIIENAQYLEFNLLLMLKYDIILKAFDKSRAITIEKYHQLVIDAENKQILEKMARACANYSKRHKGG